MNWVLDHLQLIIAAAGAVAWWLNQRRQEKAEDVAPPPEVTFEDPELAERTQRIREEIQRKIEQRARTYTQSESPAASVAEPSEPPLVVRDVFVRSSQPAPLSKAAVARLETQRTAEILEQQAAFTEQLRLATEMKAAALRRTQFETQISDKDEVAAVAVRNALGDDLRNPAALRRALILREVLGPPLALR